MKQKQNGQAMIVMAFALIVLLGVLALVIDGGRSYTLRRQDQNIADAVTMAMVRELGSGASTVTAKNVGYKTGMMSNYTLSEEDIDISETYYGSGLTRSYVVSTTVKTPLEGHFSQFIYEKIFDISAYSRMEVVLKHSPYDGFGIVSLAQSCSPNQPAIGITGGGNSGGIRLFGSTILVNNENSNTCAYSPSTSTGGTGIYAYDDNGNPLPMQSVGDYTCPTHSACTENMGVVSDGYNDGESVVNPLENLPEPTCDEAGGQYEVDGVTHYSAGNWDSSSLKDGVYAAGIYCISGQQNMKITSGNVQAIGVLLYFIDTGLEFSGQGSIVLQAPYVNDCTGVYDGHWNIYPDGDPESNASMDTTASCNYQGFDIIVASGNDSDIIVSGNGQSRLLGLIYGKDADFIASGGGSNIDESLVWGQILVSHVINSGNGSLDVWYREELVYKIPPYINALN